jgi:hypothetical protein
LTGGHTRPAGGLTLRRVTWLVTGARSGSEQAANAIVTRAMSSGARSPHAQRRHRLEDDGSVSCRQRQDVVHLVLVQAVRWNQPKRASASAKMRQVALDRTKLPARRSGGRGSPLLREG